MLITSTPTITGFRITHVFGVVFGVVVRSRGLGGNIMAGLRTIGGGEIHEYTELLEQSRLQAIERMRDRAQQLGANAIVSMRFDSSSTGSTMTEIVAFGTAVTIVPETNAPPPPPGQE